MTYLVKGEREERARNPVDGHAVPVPRYDPAGNPLEFKAFADLSQLFESAQ